MNFMYVNLNVMLHAVHFITCPAHILNLTEFMHDYCIYYSFSYPNYYNNHYNF